MARLNSGSATSRLPRAQQADVPDPLESAIATIQLAHARLLLRAARLVERFRVSVEFSADTLLQDVVVEVLEEKNGHVEPVAWCFMRMRQLAFNAATKRARREGLARDVEDALHSRAGAVRERVTSAREVVDAIMNAVTEDEQLFQLMVGFAAVAARDDVDDIRAKRRYVLQVSGLDAAQYGLALKRLDTVVRNLPEHLRAAALELLREDA